MPGGLVTCLVVIGSLFAGTIQFRGFVRAGLRTGKSDESSKKPHIS
jgi:hypothetical protein